ncbi:MAG: FAD-dependent hydroxylase [Timaviella obliquedivisa GSE-PSE-MK23-08B]|jgi:2-octaprenyl-6-methoxyphenol hydroxylase|nr:FAD-dependent hydroxylase [Timaviella obliquedivisa GSE-PSE-MK23-08B]
MVLAQHSSISSSAQQVTYDVAIAGAGIAGLTLACALKDSGLRIALIETKPRTAGLQQQRAYHLSLMTERIFTGLGIWQHILPHITTFRQISLADADYPAVVDLRPEDLGTQNLGYVGEHRVLVQALLDALESSESVTWICPAEVIEVEYGTDAAVVTIALDGEQQQIRTKLMVAADGGRSPLRQQAGIKTHGWQYWQSCVTAVIRPEASHGNIAREHFWSSGPFATLPLPNNRCQIVLTAPHDEARQWATGTEADFLAELNRRYQGQLGKLELLSDRLLFPVQLMQSDRYISPRLALVGDAAHCCHPVGGQGLNLGIRDVAALAQVLQTAHRQGKDLGSLPVLRHYERWRKLENLMILGFTDFLDRSFSSSWLPIVIVRRLGLRVMKVIRPLKFVALRMMTGTGGRKPDLGSCVKIKPQ